MSHLSMGPRFFCFPLWIEPWLQPLKVGIPPRDPGRPSGCRPSESLGGATVRRIGGWWSMEIWSINLGGVSFFSWRGYQAAHMILHNLSRENQKQTMERGQKINQQRMVTVFVWIRLVIQFRGVSDAAQVYERDFVQFPGGQQAADYSKI